VRRLCVARLLEERLHVRRDRVALLLERRDSVREVGRLRDAVLDTLDQREDLVELDEVRGANLGEQSEVER
jgi:hypothetical protein